MFAMGGRLSPAIVEDLKMDQGLADHHEPFAGFSRLGGGTIIIEDKEIFCDIGKLVLFMSVNKKLSGPRPNRP